LYFFCAPLAPKLFLANSLCVLLLFVLFFFFALAFRSISAIGRSRLFSSGIFIPPNAKKFLIPSVSNAGTVSDSLFRGVQPHLESLDELQKRGVTIIVDLRRESPQLRERERQKAESHGIHFYLYSC
jgi:hypothetical protein